MTWELLLYSWDRVGDGRSFGYLRHDDRVLRVEGHGEAAAKRRNAAIGFVVARLAQAQRRTVRQCEKNAQAFTLVDDIRDGAGQAVARCVACAVVDQQFFTVYRQDQRAPVRDGPSATQDSRTQRNAAGVDAADRQQARLANEAGHEGIRG